MALLWASGNGFIRVMVSLLGLLAVGFPCRFSTVESPTITVQGFFYAEWLDWFAA